MTKIMTCGINFSEFQVVLFMKNHHVIVMKYKHTNKTNGMYMSMICYEVQKWINAEKTVSVKHEKFHVGFQWRSKQLC